jgi:hypothetical protein
MTSGSAPTSSILNSGLMTNRVADTSGESPWLPDVGGASARRGLLTRNRNKAASLWKPGWIVLSGVTIVRLRRSQLRHESDRKEGRSGHRECIRIIPCVPRGLVQAGVIEKRRTNQCGRLVKKVGISLLQGWEFSRPLLKGTVGTETISQFGRNL